MTFRTAARDRAPGPELRRAANRRVVSSDDPVAEVIAHYRNVIRAARDSGVARSVAGSGLDGPLLAVLLRGQLRARRAAARREPVPVSIARASIYSEFFLGLLARSRTSGQLRLPAADSRISLVSRADVTRCLAPLVAWPAAILPAAAAASARIFRLAMTSCPLYRVSVPGWADGPGGDGCLPRAAASASRVRGRCDAFSLGMCQRLFVLLFHFSWVIGAQDKLASFAMTRSTADYRPSDVRRDRIWLFELWHPRDARCAPVRIRPG
jgi:hypothetical protein